MSLLQYHNYNIVFGFKTLKGVSAVQKVLCVAHSYSLELHFRFSHLKVKLLLNLQS